MANDPYERYKKYQGGILGNNLTSGLLGNPNFLIGANIFGQGLKGQDPFSSIMPSVFQAAQIQKALTPKDIRTSLQKDLEAAGFIPGTQEYKDAIKLRTLGEGTVGYSPFASKANKDKAFKAGDYAIEGIELLTNIGGISAQTPGAFGIKGKLTTLGKDIATEVEGIWKGSTKKASQMGDVDSSTWEFLGNPDYRGIQPLENALSIHIARNRNPTGRLLKDMIRDAKEDAKLTGLGGNEGVRQRLPFIFQEFLTTAKNQYAAAGLSPSEIANKLNPKIEEFNKVMSQISGMEIGPSDKIQSAGRLGKKKKTSKEFAPGEDGIWRFE